MSEAPTAPLRAERTGTEHQWRMVEGREPRPRFWNSPLHSDPLYWTGFALAVLGTFATINSARSWTGGLNAANMMNILFSGLTDPWFGFLLFGVVPAAVRYMIRKARQSATLVQATPAAGTPAGWRTDPFVASNLRYWDGPGWTNSVATPLRQRSWPWALMWALTVVNILAAVLVTLGNQSADKASVSQVDSALVSLNGSVKEYSALKPPNVGTATPQMYEAFFASSSAAVTKVQQRNQELKAAVNTSSFPATSTTGVDKASLTSITTAVDAWTSARLNYSRQAMACPDVDQQSSVTCIANAFDRYESALNSSSQNVQKAFTQLQTRTQQSN